MYAESVYIPVCGGMVVVKRTQNVAWFVFDLHLEGWAVFLLKKIHNAIIKIVLRNLYSQSMLFFS